MGKKIPVDLQVESIVGVPRLCTDCIFKLVLLPSKETL